MTLKNLCHLAFTSRPPHTASPSCRAEMACGLPTQALVALHFCTWYSLGLLTSFPGKFSSYKCRYPYLHFPRVVKWGPHRVYSSYKFCTLVAMGRLKLVLGSKGFFPLLRGSSFASLVEAFSLSLERVTPILELKFEILGPISNFFFSWFVICLYEKLLQVFANYVKQHIYTITLVIKNSTV